MAPTLLECVTMSSPRKVRKRAVSAAMKAGAQDAEAKQAQLAIIRKNYNQKAKAERARQEKQALEEMQRPQIQADAGAQSVAVFSVGLPELTDTMPTCILSEDQLNEDMHTSRDKEGCGCFGNCSIM